MPEHDKNYRPPERAINRTTRIGMITAALPEAKPLLAEYGIHCFSCAASGTETLEEGCKTHAMDHETLENLLDDLNMLFEEQSTIRAHITITRTAAEQLRNLSDIQAARVQIFAVIVDESGRPYMEECKQLLSGLHFCHPDIPEVLITADSLMLHRIGTVSIDFRNGRFTLDISSPKSCACKGKKPCACKGNSEL
ncbi:hypothetical protein A2635_03740 [Candidatus Peribacteria bacterium RIFCSPHIGHO2_01_FULL_51_9]|nr:MAG: hypothetical protein A2635_03740 [Candidatus Peribacteria bacterium RIFCSPHIGHO2_01_FULL_51_9]